MRRLTRIRRNRAGADCGFTLVELLLASTALVIVLGVTLSVIPIVLRSEPRISDRAAQIQKGRAMVERFTRELRLASKVSSATASSVVFVTYVRRISCGGPVPTDGSGAIQCQVSYTCTDAGACTRSEGPAEGSPPTGGPILVDGLMNSAVFTYLPSPTAPQSVTVKLSFPAEGGDDAVTLEDGANFRNYVPASTPPPAA